MSIANKTSLRVPFQLPEFIRSDNEYQTFVAFLQAYYEWMEQKNIGAGKEGVVYGSQSLLDYTNIDYVEAGDSYNKFIDYFFNDFLPNFPKDALTDKAKLIKIARNLYQTKGTPASYQFLFRALYNSDAEIFLTRDVVLRASDGKWYVSKSLKIDSEDIQFLSIDNLRLFGETSKSLATVERSTRSGTRIEIYISNIERLFQSGEFIRVVDNNNQTLYFKDSKIVPEGTVGSTILRAKIIGSISSVQINPQKRGQLYTGASPTYKGDPVIFYGGLNTPSGIGAEAYITEVTSGSVRDVLVTKGGYGYRADPNTSLIFTGGGGSGAIATVGSLDPTGQINVAFVPTDYITEAAKLITIGSTYSFFANNTVATSTSTLANAFTFVGLETYPINSVIVQNGGGGYKTVPSLRAETTYDTLTPGKKGKLASIGILGPIEIVSPGTGYANGDLIIFSGSAGVGANANVTVNATGSIISAQYQYANTPTGLVTAPLGGMGFRNTDLPSLSVVSSGGSNAVLRVNGVLGSGAEFNVIPDERGIGAITTITVENYGEDYIAAPKISLKVRDLAVSNLVASSLPSKGDIVYQGTSIDNFVFKANVDSVFVLAPNVNPLQTKYVLRTYNYTSNTKVSGPYTQLKITDRPAGSNLYIDIDTTYTTYDESGNKVFDQGVRTYGNGAAEATAKFLNGLIIGAGQYLKDDGFPSSFQILQDQNYNNFTYELLVQQSFDAYRDTLYKLMHPAGTKVIPINTLKSEQTINVSSLSLTSNSLPLGYYTGTSGSNATISGTFANPSNNIIIFDALVGANLANIISINTFVSISNTHGPNVYSQITSVDYTNNTATISENVFVRFANVAIGNVITSNTRINIPTLTGQYDVINNGEYSNTLNHMEDIIFIGDSIRVVSDSSSYTGTVTYVQYSNNTIFVTPAPSFTNSGAVVSVGRDLVSTNIQIYNNFGDAGAPYLATQDGNILITQDNRVITLGI